MPFDINKNDLVVRRLCQDTDKLFLIQLEKPMTKIEESFSHSDFPQWRIFQDHYDHFSFEGIKNHLKMRPLQSNTNREIA